MKMETNQLCSFIDFKWVRNISFKKENTVDNDVNSRKLRFGAVKAKAECRKLQEKGSSCESIWLKTRFVGGTKTKPCYK